MSKYAKLSAGLLAAWFVFSLFSSALHLYRNAPNTPPLALGLAVVIPIMLFLVWITFSPGFRQFVLSLSPRTLTLVQSMRIAGFVLLVLGTYKILPEFFALSEGTARLSSKRESERITQRSAAQIRPRNQWTPLPKCCGVRLYRSFGTPRTGQTSEKRA